MLKDKTFGAIAQARRATADHGGKMQGRHLKRIAFSLFLTCAACAVAPIAVTVPALAAAQVSQLAKEATALALKGNFLQAESLAKRSGDAAAIKLVELLYLRDHSKNAGYRRIMDFLKAAPNWPLAETLAKGAERTLYSNREPTEVIMAHFSTRQPVTAEGSLALARAKLAIGDKGAARKLVQQVWNNTKIDLILENAVAGEFKSLLSEADHKRRMWRLIYAQETNAAIRVSKRLGGDYQNAAKAAQALIRSAAGAEKLHAKLPSAMRQELGVKYALARHYRKLEKFAKARGVLATIPGDAAAMGDAEAWWVERRIVARRSIGVNRRDSTKTAYRIAREHGIGSGPSAVEGEFLAGWIALRSLNNPTGALRHFTQLDQMAPTRTEKARAKYWLGRTYEALERPGDAKASYTAAAQYSTVYYGQLAREEIGLGKVPEEIDSGEPSAAARAKTDKDEAVRAFRMIAATGNTRDLYMFLWSFANRFKSVDEMKAAASIVWEAGGPAMAVKLAKAAAQRELDIDAWGYPVKALPDWKQIGRPVEKSLVYALSRQESEFDPKAGSSVGAQGLMQIMPDTAKLIARQYKLPYAKAKLMGDPAYNVKLGAAHLGDLIEDFGGSYVLTLVAYNAGPRRSREWVAEYGDLRNGKIDPIDWVESIPFQETRQYVQKVLQNVHVYRSRLAPGTVRPMSADLRRGAPAVIKVAESAGQGTSACAGQSIATLISRCE